jgi:formamidopyrimidine-DNA glycosylase
VDVASSGLALRLQRRRSNTGSAIRDSHVPELPDIVVYLEALDRLVVGHPLTAVRLTTPFLVRSVDPPLEAVLGRPVRVTRRIGKRLVLGFDDDLFVVIHLMIAGRLRWREPGAKAVAGRRAALATFVFDSGSLILTEAGKTRRASLYVVRGLEALAAFDRGGLEPLTASRDDFAGRLRRENHTLKRSLTDPRLFSGIGNAYSDEILHRARLSPLLTTARLSDEQIAALHDATVDVLTDWTDRLRAEVGAGFPETVTAFREGMAVHGRFGHPCPDCGSRVQRIRYVANETNYCATCQTGGKLLADRSLSRLLRDDWPKSIDDLDT